MVLIELNHANPSARLDISAEQERAADLVSENRLYRQTAMRNGNTAMAGVLDELERVLVDISHEPSEMAPAELEGLQHRLESAGILFKIRVLGTNVKQQQEPAGSVGRPRPAEIVRGLKDNENLSNFDDNRRTVSDRLSGAGAGSATSSTRAAGRSGSAPRAIPMAAHPAEPAVAPIELRHADAISHGSGEHGDTHLGRRRRSAYKVRTQLANWNLDLKSKDCPTFRKRPWQRPRNRWRMPRSRWPRLTPDRPRGTTPTLSTSHWPCSRAITRAARQR